MDNVKDQIELMGRVEYVLCDKDGKVKQQGVTHNLVTANGATYLAQLVYGGTTKWATCGMKLGTSSTAASATGVNSYTAAGDYIAGTAQTLDLTYPKVGAAANIAQFKVTWTFGGAVSNINSASIVDNTTNGAEAGETHTLARAVLTGIPINAILGDTLAITWTITTGSLT